jgi:hypothetical protein
MVLCLVIVIESGNLDRSAHRYTNVILAIMLASVLLLVTNTSNRSVYATHVGTFSDLWGIEAATIAKIHHFDPSTDTSTAIPRVPSLSMENGRGMASDGTYLWYTILMEGFRGDGKIHKIAPNGGADIATIPDPFGFNGSGIQSLDFDSAGYLWGISRGVVIKGPYNNPYAVIFKLDSNTGTVLASCEHLITVSGNRGPLAIVNGKILTNFGNGLTNHLEEYNPPSGIGGECTATGNMFTLPVTVSGIDTDDAGNLLVTDLHNLYNLGQAPYNTIISSQPNAFYPYSEIDITTKPELDVKATVCKLESVQHWDKIVFMVTDPKLASQVNVTANTELDIKVLDDPQKVADLKQKVLDFIGAPNGNKSSIKIIDVEYAIICAMPPPPSSEVVPSEFPDTNTASVVPRLNLSNPLIGMGEQVQGMNTTSKSPS